MPVGCKHLLSIRIVTHMARKHIITILLVEPEMPEGISARKLVVETAKHNVISAYGGREGLQMFRRFPEVDAVVIHSELEDMRCDDVARSVREQDKDIPIVVLSARAQTCSSPPVDEVLPSHEPKALLEYLAEKLGATTKN
jgi:CheY-like chemotaxis protein